MISESQSNSPWLSRLFSVLVLFQATGCSLFRPPVPDAIPVYHARSETESLRAGAAVVDITPSENLWMGGYGILRMSEGVHDALYARVLVLESGDLRLGLVALDLVGLQYQDVLSIREGLEGIDPRHVVVASTHTHSGPDTIGIWGFPPFVSGVDEQYAEQVKGGVLEAYQTALKSLRPVEVAYGAKDVSETGILKNIRRPGVVDREIVVLHVREAGGGPTVATVVEVGCHPEVLGDWNRQITADFPHWTVAKVEAELGGVAIYVSGALGAMVTPDVLRREPPNPAEEWSEAERVGNHLGGDALSVVGSFGEYRSGDGLRLWHAPMFLRNQNFQYDLIRWTGLIERQAYGSGYFRTEVNLWQVGRFRLATIPGEMTPGLGLRVKRALAGEPTMLVGLANDELGYLLPAAEYDLPIYEYERTLCAGPDTADRIVRRLEDLGLLAE